MASTSAGGAASDNSASVASPTTVVSAGGTRITFTNGATASPTPQPSGAPQSAGAAAPIPPSSKSSKRPPPAPEDAPITRNTTRRLSSSTERPRYREMSSDSGGEVSDGDPPGYVAPPLAVSNGQEQEVPLVERNYLELEDIIFSNPKTFTSMVFEIGQTRRANLFVSADRTDKKASAFMHITCAYRGAGCPFILKLTRAKEGGWILKPATSPTGEVDTKGSFYACRHPPGSLPDNAPILGPTGGVAPPGSVYGGVPPPLMTGGAASPAAVGASFSFASGSEATPPPGKSKTKKKGPALKKAAAPKKGSPAESPAPLDYQSDSVSGKLVPSRESRIANVADRNTLANPQVVGNMVKTKPMDPDRALAPPFLRSLSLQKQITPVLSYERYNTPGESSLNARAPHYIPAASSSFPSHLGREQPHASTSAARHASPTYDHRSAYTLPVQPSQNQHSSTYSLQSQQAQQSRSQPVGQIHPGPPSHHQSQQLAGDQAYPYQPSYRHILVAQPPSAPAPPRPSLLPTTSSLASWTAFLTALDPTLVPFAKVLAAPTMALTPESFFAESLEMRLALIEVLEVEQVGVWPRLRLKLKVKEKGEEVWKKVEEEEKKRNREQRAKEVEMEREREKARERIREQAKQAEKEQQARAQEAREQESRAREQQAQVQAQAMEGVEPATSTETPEIVMKEVNLVAAAPAPAASPKTTPSAASSNEKHGLPAVDTSSAPPALAPAPVVEPSPESNGKRGTKASKFKAATKPASTSGSAPPSIAAVSKPSILVPTPSPSSTSARPPNSAPAFPSVLLPPTAAPPATSTAASATAVASSSTALTAAALQKVNSKSTRKEPRAPTSPLSSAMSIFSDEDGDIPLVQLSAKAREASKALELKSVAQLRQVIVTYAEGFAYTGRHAIKDTVETIALFDGIAWPIVSEENRRGLLDRIEKVMSARREWKERLEREEDEYAIKESIERMVTGEDAILLQLRRGGQDPFSPLEPIDLISDHEETTRTNAEINGQGIEGSDSPRDGSPDELLVTAVRRPSSTSKPGASPEVSRSCTSSSSYAPPPPPRPPSANSGAGVRSSIGGAPTKNGPLSKSDVKSAVALAFRKASTAGADGRVSSPASPAQSPTISTRAPPASAPSKRPRSPTPPPVYPTLGTAPPPPPPTSSGPRVESAGDKVRRELAYRHTPPAPKSSPRPPSGTIIPFPTGPPKEKNPAPPPPPPPSNFSPAIRQVTAAASPATASTNTPRSSYPPPRPSGTPSFGPDPSIRIKTPASSLSASTSRLPSTEPRQSNGNGTADQGRRSSWYGPSGGRDDDSYGGIPGLSPPPPPPPPLNGGGMGNGPRYAANGGPAAPRNGYNDRWAPHSNGRDDGYGGGQAKRRRN